MRWCCAGAKRSPPATCRRPCGRAAAAEIPIGTTKCIDFKGGGETIDGTRLEGNRRQPDAGRPENRDEPAHVSSQIASLSFGRVLNYVSGGNDPAVHPLFGCRHRVAGAADAHDRGDDRRPGRLVRPALLPEFLRAGGDGFRPTGAESGGRPGVCHGLCPAVERVPGQPKEPGGRRRPSRPGRTPILPGSARRTRIWPIRPSTPCFWRVG